MDPILIVVIVVVLLVVVLATFGYIANRRRFEAEDASLRARVQAADQHLARAHAEDKGWERAGLEAAALDAFRSRHGREPSQLMLVQVVDMPGTDEDEAVFEEPGGTRVVLGRTGNAWVARG